MNYLTIFFSSLFLGTLILPVKAETDLNKIISSKQGSQYQSQQTQNKIVEMDQETTEIVNEYRSLLKENAVLMTYNQQLDKQQELQKLKLESLDKNMANVREVRMQLMPLMQEMVEVLTVFVNNDIPFLWQERQLRLAELTNLLDNPNIAIADKYRRIVEAYQIETEYGDTIETWQAQLPLTDEDKTAHLIRIGRIGLYYLTPDQQTAGYWDNNSRSWKPLPESWLASIKQAYDVADNRSVPALLTVPLIEKPLQQEAL
jgi:hypothetical protein